MTDEEFGAFIDRCYAEFEAKQKALKELGISSFERYWWDQDTRRLQFFDGADLKMEFHFVVIGTWAHKEDDWLWGWANDSFLQQCRDESAALKQLAEITGFDFATQRHVEADEKMAHEIIAMALHVLNARGMYRHPGETSHMYLALF
jgi:hypothetical protein